MTSKKTPADRFLEFAATIPPLPTSLLATGHAPAMASEARRAVLMVDGLEADDGRIERNAANLDRLAELNRAASSNAGRRRRRP